MRVFSSSVFPVVERVFDSRFNIVPIKNFVLGLYYTVLVQEAFFGYCRQCVENFGRSVFFIHLYIIIVLFLTMRDSS